MALGHASHCACVECVAELAAAALAPQVPTTAQVVATAQAKVKSASFARAWQNARKQINRNG